MTKKHSKTPPRSYYIVSLCFAVMIITLSSLSIFEFFSRSPLVTTIETSDEAFSFWQKIVQEHPSYRDGYLALARLYIEDNDIPVAENLIKQARKLDPNKEIILPSLR